MSAEENKEKVRRLMKESFGGGKPELVDELLDSDFVRYDLMQGMVVRRAMWMERTGTLAFFVLALLVAVLIGLVLAAGPAHAATFTVNSTGDAQDVNNGEGICATVSEECTLRAAIEEANANKGKDTINFAIPGAGPHTISPGSQLPFITKPVIIDGYTQSGATKNTLTEPGKTNANLKIRLDGFDAGLTFFGASNSVVRGLSIGGCLADSCSTGIFLSGGEGYKVEGNFFGVAPDGTSGNANKWGVLLTHTADSTIGGATPEARNLISGNVFEGVLVTSSSSGNKIQGNIIGTDKNGNPLGNGDSGVALIFAGNGNRILSNSIFSNGDLGIDLSSTSLADGVTANDDRDPDTGPNRLQNYPVITSAQTFGNFTSINGTLNSTPSTRKKTRTFIIQFFSSPSKDSSNFGEGKNFIGQVQVTTNRQGNASFSFAPSQKVPVGQFITATATNKKTGDTSEFSEARVVEELVIGP